MSINTFDAALWVQHAPTGGDYGDHITTPGGSVLLDGSCYAQAAVLDLDSVQESPAAVERVMRCLISSVKEHTGAAVVRLAELEAYTTRDGADALNARFAYSR